MNDQQWEERDRPALSFVIACLNIEGLESILTAVREQRSADVETIVVSEFKLAQLLGKFPRVHFLTLAPGSLAPQLWSAGIEAARGRLVATTTSHFLQSPGYAFAAIHAHERIEAAGIGGRIRPPERCGPTAWAVYLLRYSAYLSLKAAQEVEDFAGDNGTYKAEALLPYLDFIRERGFWEHEVHQLMRKDGAHLAFDPSIEVRQIATFPFLDFVRQRFRHGCLYGEGLATGQPLGRRMILACRGAFVPALLVWRVARRVFAIRQHRGAFLASLPQLSCFATAWGAGEVAGCITGNRPRRPD